MNYRMKIYIYYGILFYFLYTQIYGIICSLLVSPILIMQWNIYLVPIFLLLFTTLLSIWFYRAKKFPKIKIWFILLIVILSIIISFLNIPSWFYLFDYNSAYTIEKRSMIMDYILYSESINLTLFLVISCFKYLKKCGNVSNLEL